MILEYEEIVEASKCGQLLNKYFLNCFRKGYVRVKGCLLPLYFKKFGHRILEMEIRDEDIWVCSFPKTGTTWTQEMIWLLVNDLDYNGAKTFLPERFPFLEHTPLFDYEDVMAVNKDISPPDYVLDSVSHISSMKSPRLVKSHLPFELLPLELQERKTKAKIIYTCRNPKDTCVSYFHHCRNFEGYTGSFDDFITLFLNDSLCFAPYPEHVNSYWKLRDDPNVLFLFYEDMKKDLKDVLRRAACFLGKTYSDEELDRLKEHLSFESMKNNPAVNYDQVVEFNKKHQLIANMDGKFMRSGQVGGWKAEMNTDTVIEFDRWTRQRFHAPPESWTLKINSLNNSKKS